MRRREFFGFLGGAAACPLAARAQSDAPAPAGVTKPDDVAGKLDPLLQQAQELGAPAAAIARAVAISRQPIFPKKDVLAVFDISQPSANKRFYVLDFKSGQVTAHFAAHGRTNGPNARATKFKGFQRDLDMVPLGPLKTAHPEVMEHDRTIVDRYDGTVYRNMIVAGLEGAKWPNAIPWRPRSRRRLTISLRSVPIHPQYRPLSLSLPRYPGCPDPCYLASGRQPRAHKRIR